MKARLERAESDGPDAAIAEAIAPMAETAAPIANPGEAARPWEMVGAGRYMPRRIRGSFRGRELG